MREIVERILHDKLKLTAPLAQIVKLHGDASYRTYYRAKLSDGQTFIVMQMPSGKASVSEEITNFEGTHRELPFINIARFLSMRGIPTPTMYCYSEGDHLMIIEDLGDDLMVKRVDGADRTTQLYWYRKAIDLLVKIQQETSEGDGEECVALARSFDATLLNWEFDHFLEYGIEARIGMKMEEGDLKTFNSETRTMSEKISALPYSFTHRDFQSRNLLIRNGDLSVIDFQDALLGPAAYDLVSLLRDSYVRLADDVLEELIRYYADLSMRRHDELRAEFDLVTIQRKLKDAGRFAYIDRVKGNPDFLKYIPTSLGYVKAALDRMPRHQKFYNVLKRYVPEWS